MAGGKLVHFMCGCVHVSEGDHKGHWRGIPRGLVLQLMSCRCWKLTSNPLEEHSLCS